MCTNASQAGKLEIKVEISPPQTYRKATSQKPSCKPAACGDLTRPAILTLTMPNVGEQQITKLGKLI
jgi:hypothetical protein